LVAGLSSLHRSGGSKLLRRSLVWASHTSPEPLTPSKEHPVKRSTVLTALSLLNALFFGLHLTGDVVFGIEKGGREILVGVLILAVYLYGAVGLPERRAGYLILLLGERFAQLPGGFLFIWTLLTTGATGLVAFVLSVQAIWSLRQRPRASA
jgi:hypothetical protein